MFSICFRFSNCCNVEFDFWFCTWRTNGKPWIISQEVFQYITWRSCQFFYTGSSSSCLFQEVFCLSNISVVELFRSIATEFIHDFLDFSSTIDTWESNRNSLFCEVAVFFVDFFNTISQCHATWPVVGCDFGNDKNSLDSVFITYKWFDEVTEAFFKTKHVSVIVLCFKFMNLFTDKFESSQDVKHSSAVAFRNLSYQLSWYDWFTKSCISWKGTSCFVSFEDIFGDDSTNLVTWKVEVRTIWLANFNTKTVCIRVSCNQYVGIYFTTEFFSKSKGFLVFWVWWFDSREVSIWNSLSFNDLNSIKSSLSKCTTCQHFTCTVKWCVDNLHVTTVFINQVLVDVDIFNFFQVFSINIFTDDFNESTSLAFF